jgi:hypothetical protein
MASWDDVKGFLKSNFNVTKDDGGTVTIEQKFSDGRSQLLFVRRLTASDVVWADIASPVGTIEPGKMDAALAFLEEKSPCGGLVKIGQYHSVRHSVPIADLSGEEIAFPLRALAAAADTLEEHLIGGDNA